MTGKFRVVVSYVNAMESIGWFFLFVRGLHQGAVRCQCLSRIPHAAFAASILARAMHMHDESGR